MSHKGSPPRQPHTSPSGCRPVSFPRSHRPGGWFWWVLPCLRSTRSSPGSPAGCVGLPAGIFRRRGSGLSASQHWCPHLCRTSIHTPQWCGSWPQPGSWVEVASKPMKRSAHLSLPLAPMVPGKPCLGPFGRRGFCSCWLCTFFSSWWLFQRPLGARTTSRTPAVCGSVLLAALEPLMGPEALVALVRSLVAAFSLCLLWAALALVVQVAYLNAFPVQTVEPLLVLLGAVFTGVAAICPYLLAFRHTLIRRAIVRLALRRRLPFVAGHKHQEGGRQLSLCQNSDSRTAAAKQADQGVPSW